MNIVGITIALFIMVKVFDELLPTVINQILIEDYYREHGEDITHSMRWLLK